MESLLNDLSVNFSDRNLIFQKYYRSDYQFGVSLEYGSINRITVLKATYHLLNSLNEILMEIRNAERKFTEVVSYEVR
jgi:hypothetical protein